MNKTNNFLIGNVLIERAIKEYYKVDSSDFLPVVFEAVRRRMNEDGHFLIPINHMNENGFSWLDVPLPDGSRALAVFTNQEEAEKGPQAELMSNYIISLLEFALEAEAFAGILINPWDKAVFIEKGVISQMFQINENNGDGRRIVVENSDNSDKCQVEIPDQMTVGDIADLESYYEYALEKTKEMPIAFIPALRVQDAEVSETSFYATNYIYKWIEAHPDCETIFVMFCSDEEAFERYDTAARIGNAGSATTALLLEEMRKNRPVAKKDDWKRTLMPACFVELTLHHPLSEAEKEGLRYGNIPECMEDKWFCYVENDVLYAHRSWTGNCIYEIDFSGVNSGNFDEDGETDANGGSFDEDVEAEANGGIICSFPAFPPSDTLRVKINHDMDEYPWTDLDEEIEFLHDLLNSWTELSYDRCSRWFDESQTKSGHGNDVPVMIVKKAEDTALVIKRPNYRAEAIDRGGKIVVLKGSTINPEITGVMPPKALEMRTEGLKNGTISEGFELLEDFEFGSLSASAAFVVGHTVSGPKTWKAKK